MRLCVYRYLFALLHFSFAKLTTVDHRVQATQLTQVNISCAQPGVKKPVYMMYPRLLSGFIYHEVLRLCERMATYKPQRVCVWKWGWETVGRVFVGERSDYNHQSCSNLLGITRNTASARARRHLHIAFNTF